MTICAISCNGTFLLSFRLLTGHHVFTLRGYIATSWPGVHLASPGMWTRFILKLPLVCRGTFSSLLEAERTKKAFLKTPRRCRHGSHRPHQWTDGVILPFFTSWLSKLIIQEALQAEFVPTFKKVSLQISFKHHALPVFVHHFFL